MGGAGVILGDWTHRRGDVGGARAVAADVTKARPAIAWTFRPAHGGQVDQVRIAGDRVYVATMAPGDPAAVGWEHATVFAIEASSGRVIARRTLPDPVPVAAMLVDGSTVHVLATREGEPVFWYALDAFDLRPRSRCPLAFDGEAVRGGAWDVLEAWASADGGLWLELEAHDGARAYAFANGGEARIARRATGSAGDAPNAVDACCAGHTLYAPAAGDDATPASIWQLEPGAEASPAAPWALMEITGAAARAHAIVAGGAVTAVAVGAGGDNERRALVQAVAIDRASGVVRAQSIVEKLAVRAEPGDAARLARRPNGDVLFQCVGEDGGASSDLWRVSPAGEITSMPLPRDTLLLDAALGEAVLTHGPAKKGRVIVSALDIDRERLLGKRAQTLWSIETPDLGPQPTIYAGAGHVIARGASALSAIRV